MESLAALVAKIQDKDLTSGLDSESRVPHGFAWLDEILEPWVKAEKEFWSITLEQDELRAYTKAVSMQLIGEDDYTVPGFRLSNYERPSMKRKRFDESNIDRDHEERLELELKERRKNARTAIARDRKVVNGLTAKAAKLKAKIAQYEESLARSSREFDKLLAESLASTLAPTQEIRTDLDPTSEYAAKLARAVSRKYQTIEKFWESNKGQPNSMEARQERLKEVWGIFRAVAVLESEVYHQELASILEMAMNKGPEILSEESYTQDIVPSAVEMVQERLESARKKDESETLRRENKLLTEVEALLRRHLMPPLFFLYTGLLRLHTHIEQALAQCDVLLSELESMQARLDESNFQAALDEDDELLIQLAELLQIQTDENGELPSETVLQRLKELCGTAS